MITRLPTLIFICFALCGCHRQTPERSFYYWKTTFHLSAGEEKYLSDLNVHKLYLRLFDVDWDDSKNTASPLGKIDFVSKPRLNLDFVPVVYIVNKTLQKTAPTDLQSLASKILGLVQSLTDAQKLNFSELQIDCDWTETTRDKYFRLLTYLKGGLIPTHRILSATIRLHQVKYASVTGIPPVDRGMLMYYNMGKIDAASPRNSIYNQKDASKYVAYVSKYPLPLDVALPVFSWGVHIRGNKVVDLLNNMSPEDFKNNANFRPTDSTQLIVDSSFFFRGFYFMKNDLIKLEEVTPALCMQAAQQLTGKLQNRPGTVALFHFDSLMMARYEEKKLEEIFNSFP